MTSPPTPQSSDENVARRDDRDGATSRGRRAGAVLRRNSPLLAAVTILTLGAGAGGAVAGTMITGAQIKDGTVTSRDLGTNAVTVGKIKAGSVQAWDLTMAARAALKGQPGAPGSRWLTGAGAPGNITGNITGNNGDWYLDTTNRDLYTRIGGAWGFVINIGGIKGDPGAPGAPGTPGAQGPKGDKGEKGDTGAAGSNGANGTNGTSGADGKAGSAWLSGASAPANTLGADGDWYLDTTTSQAFQKVSGAWVSRVNLKGIQGEKGVKGDTGAAGTNGTNGTNGENGDDGMDGATWYTGAGVPANTLGADNDLYLNTATSDVYKKSSGAWSLLTNIKGQKGDPGTNGTNGANGAAGTNGTSGTTWLTGAGAPVTGGVDGDLYLDTTNGDVYKKASGNWGSPIANLTGPAGSDGSGGSGTSWSSGAGAPSGQTNNPAVGAFYLNTTNGAIYKADGETWTAIYTPPTAVAGSTQLIANKIGGTSESCPISTSTNPPTVAFNNVVTAPSGGNTWTGSNTFTVGVGQGGMFMFQARVLTPDAATPAQTVPISLTLQINNTTYGSIGNIYGPYPSVSGTTPPGTKGRGELVSVVPLNEGDTVKVLCIGANPNSAPQPLSAHAGSNLTVVKVN